MIFLSTIHLISSSALAVAGVCANGISLHYVIKYFDVKKAFFQLLLLDGIMGVICCFSEFVTSALFLIVDRNEVLCSTFLFSNSFGQYHGLVIALELACVRSDLGCLYM